MPHRRIHILLIGLLLMLCAGARAEGLAPTVTRADSLQKGRFAAFNDSLRQERLITLTDSLHRDATRELNAKPLMMTAPMRLTDAGTAAGVTDSVATSLDSVRTTTRRELRAQRLASFTPDPGKATWAALVFPGGGQIYNHKYWKLPIVYGGFIGCAYALNWNNQMYSDYSQAYLDIMDDDPGTASYEDFLPPRYNVEANKDYLKRVFKNRKDNYRRQRDLSIFSFIGVYLLSVVDAYVDAELSNFDISEDLSVQVRPSIIDTPQQHLRNQSYGLHCSFSF